MQFEVSEISRFLKNQGILCISTIALVTQNIRNKRRRKATLEK